MTKRSAEPAPPEVLPDEAARRAIREDLETTLLVEAAAGTGKTRSLVERMVALVEAGRPVDRLSAVTFTIRAAAQLRQRFQNALEDAVAKAEDPIRRERLATALGGLDSCFLGTIHAFAARLLRERPVEAGVDPGFEEMDEPEDGVARGQGWDRFAEGLFVREDPRLARLLELGIPLSDLRGAYETVCENSDIEPALGQPRPEPDFSDTRRRVSDFLEQAWKAVPQEPPEGGWTDFQEALRRARRLSGILDLERAPEFVRVLKVLRMHSALDAAGAFKKSFETFREQVVKPALARWAEYVHPFVIPLLVEARDEYAAWRRREGRLNFQDLLLYARELLRSHPRVRQALRERFTPTLVDEFQDTDPIQAEILLYLTGVETDQTDWRRLTPAPGSLFVVGDPKQSIYRFRRADIETYELVRDKIASCGRLVELSASLRASAALCNWVNRVFSDSARFPASPTAEQAAYVALSPVRTGAEGPAALRLEVPVSGPGDRPVVDLDAARIAAEVAAAVARHERPPGDFLLLFRRRRHMPDYARALEARGVPYEIAGGGAFGDSEELAALMPILEALADPDNPVPFLSALRGPLFGVDDEALYRFSRDGGRFHFRAALPEGCDPRIARACAQLAEAEELVTNLPPGAAMSRIVERLGWAALAGASELGEGRAGNLLKALAAARKFSGEGLDFPAVVRELTRMREEELIEQMSVEPGRPGAVRLMTLHGAKGLEAPVVFLADPTGETGRPRDYWIDRRAEPPAGHFRVAKRAGERSWEEVARPPGWDAMQEIEERFERAERVRLLYVGATRARERLIVSVKRTRTGLAGGPWKELAAYIPDELPGPSFDVEAEPPPPLRRIPEELDAFRRRRAERRERSAVATKAVAPVTDLAHAESPRPDWERTGRGMSWGRVVHRLLEAAMRDDGLDLRAYAANLLSEEERPEADLEEVVRLAEGARSSPLWRRARASRRRLVEVPFALEVRSAELGRTAGPERTLLTGAIDLAFEEEGGWILVDYKSDTVTPENLDGLVAFYRPQVAHYRRWWERLTGQPARAGLFFVGSGLEAWLD